MRTKEEKSDDIQTINWYIYATFGVYDDMKSHTRACMTLGNGMICAKKFPIRINIPLFL